VSSERTSGSFVWAKNDEALDIALYAQFLDTDQALMIAFTNPSDFKYNRRTSSELSASSSEERLTFSTQGDNSSVDRNTLESSSRKTYPYL